MTKEQRDRATEGSLHIAWTGFQRRQVAMAPYMRFKCIFVGARARGGFLRLYDYFLMALKSLIHCVRSRARVIWMQVPPTPLILTILLGALFFRNRVILIADCHNSILRPPWSKVPFSSWLLNRCDLAVFHNRDAAAEALRNGVDPLKVRVLEDAPITLNVNRGEERSRSQRVRFFFPASFSADEPIEAVMRVATLMPEAEFWITGDYKRSRRPTPFLMACQNVKLTGFLELPAFDEALQNSDIVLALTNMEGVQLSACNEAIGAGKPMVMSATRTLIALFPVGNVPCKDAFDVPSLLAACREASVRRESLRCESEKLREERRVSWRSEQADPLLSEIDALCVGGTWLQRNAKGK